MKYVAVPNIPPVLNNLASPIKKIKSETSFQEVIVDNIVLNNKIIKGLSFKDSKLDKVDFSESKLDKLDLLDVIVKNSQFTATSCTESSWQRVELRNIQGSGIKLQDSSIRDVVFEDSKLDFANFRFSKFTNVKFKNCVLDEADFYSAELVNVSFEKCQLFNTEFSSAKIKNVDLRTSTIEQVKGVVSLRGAMIDSVQLVSLAPLLANNLGLIVVDES